MLNGRTVIERNAQGEVVARRETFVGTVRIVLRTIKVRHKKPFVIVCKQLGFWSTEDGD